MQEAIEREKQRVEWEERQKRWQEEEAIRRKGERERKHGEAIETVIRHRKDDLLKAAEWWRLHEAVRPQRDYSALGAIERMQDGSSVVGKPPPPRPTTGS